MYIQLNEINITPEFASRSKEPNQEQVQPGKLPKAPVTPTNPPRMLRSFRNFANRVLEF